MSLLRKQPVSIRKSTDVLPLKLIFKPVTALKGLAIEPLLGFPYQTEFSLSLFRFNTVFNTLNEEIN